ncbi:outer membrane transport energization protein ExbB [Fontimonas thermophila]|uniref:Outer membrane transport energization protein ExbB n=1 Tax=Fontimonas thermophila TaxID=1076937 RepID=A0A1I2KF28_9GAMM|nr:MotA/TolQ/ExbB proton channel family protein [Fontimonas thermophila]SFF63711.1 outer membrane transport energization protein ExbB [Fontimonas thermophila]
MLAQWLQLGGVAMLLLVALSLVASTLILVKLWEFWEWRLPRGDRVARALDAWRRRCPEQALAQLAGERTPLAGVLATAIAALAEPGVREEQARERAAQDAVARLERMRSGLGALELIGQIAPLLGLFGTVLGMIEAFRALEASGGEVRPELLAGGIWQALLTTAAGLAIAMPVLAVQNALERVVERHRLAMEAALTQLFTRPRADAA